MAEMFKDPMLVYPVREQEERTQTTATSPRAPTPGQGSLTEVFAGPITPSSRAAAAESSLTSPGLYDAVAHDFPASRSPRTDALISVVTRDGEELHYPVVQGRAGGSIHPAAASSEASGSPPSNAAARAHRHASLAAAAQPRGSDAERAETPEEAAEAYQQSRATPSSIQRHRRSSPGCSRSPPPTVALRGEPVEATARETNSPAASLSSSLATTPRQSVLRTPELSVLEGGAPSERRHHHSMLVDGVSVRVEEMGVSTPEMAEYFADSSHAFSSSATSQPARRPFVTPRHSLQPSSGASGPHPHAESSAPPARSDAVLERLLRLMEEQSKQSQQLLQRMQTLESTNRSLVSRIERLEAEQRPREDVVLRVSAESGSPSVTRTSGSMDSVARPSTRAPSKAVN